jgi:hypothetical protein
MPSGSDGRYRGEHHHLPVCAHSPHVSVFIIFKSAIFRQFFVKAGGEKEVASGVQVVHRADCRSCCRAPSQAYLAIASDLAVRHAYSYRRVFGEHHSCGIASSSGSPVHQPGASSWVPRAEEKRQFQRVHRPRPFRV